MRSARGPAPRGRGTGCRPRRRRPGTRRTTRSTRRRPRSSGRLRSRPAAARRWRWPGWSAKHSRQPRCRTRQCRRWAPCRHWRGDPRDRCRCTRAAATVGQRAGHRAGAGRVRRDEPRSWQPPGWSRYRPHRTSRRDQRGPPRRPIRSTALAVAPHSVGARCAVGSRRTRAGGGGADGRSQVLGAGRPTGERPRGTDPVPVQGLAALRPA